LVDLTAIWYIFPFWYVAQSKIWQPWYSSAWHSGDELVGQLFGFLVVVVFWNSTFFGSSAPGMTSPTDLQTARCGQTRATGCVREKMARNVAHAIFCQNFDITWKKVAKRFGLFL
jgi:hypothetical protein